jgi:hypothetical protein
MKVEDAIRQLQAKLSSLSTGDPKRKYLEERLSHLLSSADPFKDLPPGGLHARMESTGQYVSPRTIGDLKRRFAELKSSPAEAASEASHSLVKKGLFAELHPESLAKKSGPLGKALKIGGKYIGPALWAYLLGNSAKEAYQNTRLSNAIDRVQPKDPRQLLDEIRQEELLRARTGRLAQQDPATMMLLKRLLSGKAEPRRLARGEVLIGGPPPTPDAGDEDVQRLIAALG